ncbi:hypothetical protein [Mycobacterium sp.]|uniref:hypothetical protein n=1 Tax=Mycobacterium sp. TaxID=1785 RepID=UPI002B74560E|nr:hypothetical protein [Mycobacterium sp.]HTQ22508.1 hypothetical protein [Mycobacterium sp.]
MSATCDSLRTVLDARKIDIDYENRQQGTLAGRALGLYDFVGFSGSDPHSGHKPNGPGTRSNLEGYGSEGLPVSAAARADESRHDTATTSSFLGGARRTSGGTAQEPFDLAVRDDGHAFRQDGLRRAEGGG